MSLHEDLFHTLRCFEAADADSASRRSRWLECAGDERLLSRSGHPAHFTASALPMTGDGTRVCLVHHRGLGLWVQPGGHFERQDRSVAQAASREMYEETGLEGVVDPVPVCLSRHAAPCRQGAWHLDLQLVAMVVEREARVSDESHDVAWFPVDGLPARLAPGVVELMRAGRERLSRSGSSVPPPPPA